MEKPNLKYIKKLAGKDANFEKQLLSVLKDEFPAEVKMYLQFYHEGDYNKMAETVHKLKHKISILNLKKDYDLASKFESELKQQNENLHVDFEKVLNKIADFLNKI